jgi:hypothetical protein
VWENIEGEDRAADEATERYSVYESFRPSTEISDAWEVVDKLRDSGFYVGIKMPPKGKSESCWVRVEDYYGEKYYPAYAEKIPLTICLAALKTVGIEIEMEELINE